jgi:oligoendopeptidase F
MQQLLEKDDSMHAAVAIPTRDQVKVEDTWDLAPLFRTVDDWRAALAAAAGEFEKITQWKGRVGESAATLRDVVEFEKAGDIQIENLWTYASLKCAEDGTNSSSLGL